MSNACKIVMIGGEKGGTGKSTTATNLAVHLKLEGVDVMLLDADKQGTSYKFIDRRDKTDLPKIPCVQKLGNIYNTAMDLAKRCEVLIIDAGGRDSPELRSGMVAADVIYIPIKASQADLETLPTVDELVTNARAMNPELQAFALLCLAPSNPLINEVEEAQQLLQDFPNLKLSECIIRDRKAFRDALLEGKGVVEMRNSLAKAEIQLLAQEIFE
jgi:chromosome partitioning protein